MATQKSILVVDDEVSERNALRYKFTLEGFSILEAKDGEEGLRIALREHPDIILLDIFMPVMDGMTMLNKLRAKNEWGKTVSVIILTNLNEAKNVPKAVANGTYEYLVKSEWRMEDIVEKVKEKLRLA